MPEISRRQFAVYLVAVVLVVLLGGRALRATPDTGIPAPVAAGGFTASGEPGTKDGATGPGSTGEAGVGVTTETERLVVHVAGAVRHPGVYELGGGSRIRDALAEAGGSRAGADLDVLNLAAKLTDGQQVLVARRGKAGAAPAGAAGGGATATGAGTGVGSGAGTGAAAGAGSAGAPAAGGVVNVNQADVTQLEVLVGVGPAIAAKIVDWRTQNGPFRTVDDLAQVPGIGPKKLEAMRTQVVT